MRNKGWGWILAWGLAGALGWLRRDGGATLLVSGPAEPFTPDALAAKVRWVPGGRAICRAASGAG